MSGYADCVDREAAWFTSDTLPSFPDAPPLSAATTPTPGPFELIQGYLPQVMDGPQRALYIYTAGRARSERISTGLGGQAYPFVAYIRWPFTAGVGDGLLEGEMAALNTAVDLVLTRIRGPQGDKTHGGAFLSVAEIGGLMGGLQDDIDIEPTDPVAAVESGAPLEVRLHYTVVDHLFVQ